MLVEANLVDNLAAWERQWPLWKDGSTKGTSRHSWGIELKDKFVLVQKKKKKPEVSGWALQSRRSCFLVQHPIRVPSCSQLLHFWPNPLLMHLGQQQRMVQILMSPCISQGKLRRTSLFLALAWPNFTSCSIWASESVDGRYLYLSDESLKMFKILK